MKNFMNCLKRTELTKKMAIYRLVSLITRITLIAGGCGLIIQSVFSRQADFFSAGITSGDTFVTDAIIHQPGAVSGSMILLFLIALAVTAAANFIVFTGIRTESSMNPVKQSAFALAGYVLANIILALLSKTVYTVFVIDVSMVLFTGFHLLLLSAITVYDIICICHYWKNSRACVQSV